HLFGNWRSIRLLAAVAHSGLCAADPCRPGNVQARGHGRAPEILFFALGADTGGADNADNRERSLCARPGPAARGGRAETGARTGRKAACRKTAAAVEPRCALRLSGGSNLHPPEPVPVSQSV